MKKLLAALLLLAAPAYAQTPLNLNANPYFDTGTTGWTVGSGWTYDGAGKMVHTLGQTGTLSQASVVLSGYPIIISVSMTRTGPSGSLLVQLGASSVTFFGSAQAQATISGGTVALTVTPSPDCQCTIDSIVIIGSTGGATPFGAITLGDGLPLAAGRCAIKFAGGACITATTSTSFFIGTEGTGFASFANNSITISSTALIGWSSGAVGVNGPDWGVTRTGVGVGRFSNASTGPGSLTFSSIVTANTGALNLNESDSGAWFSNTGDSDGSTFTLPDNPGIRGDFYGFCVVAGFSMAISANTGETLRDGASTGTTITSSTVGSCVQIINVTNTAGAQWFVTFKSGTWVVS